MRGHNFRLIYLIQLGILAALASACQQAGAPSAPPGGGTDLPDVITATEPISTERELGNYYDRALAGEFAGSVVTITGTREGAQAGEFLRGLEDFENNTGIDIQYNQTAALFEPDAIPGEIADIGDIPQPSLLAEFAAEGNVVDLSTFLSGDYLEGQYDPSLLEMTIMEGPIGRMRAGVWTGINPKSVVWYPKDKFAAAGYAVPESWEELIQLSDQMVADGRTPWCIGIESGSATGWPATDWMEDILLRTTSLENYDAWVQGEQPFSSVEVRRAAELMAEVFLSEGYVYGGRTGLVSSSFAEAPIPMFDDPPGCWMHRQAAFIIDNFPPEVQPGVDYDFFYLPPIDEAYGRPVLIVGNMSAMFNDRPEVRAVIEYFTRAESVKSMMQAGTGIAPHTDAPPEWYGNEIAVDLAGLVENATSFRHDGSDLMPAEVIGTFWGNITDFLVGTMDLETALAGIDASWP